jgi:poly(3-hydroxybutyrate) depolymerase
MLPRSATLLGDPMSICRSIRRLLPCLLLAAAHALAAPPAKHLPPPLPRLPALGLDAQAVTVSGLSSGGYMAAQFEVAYSASLAGAAVIAGGPYGCSRGQVSTAMFNCSCPAASGLQDVLLHDVPGACQVLAQDVYLNFAQRATAGNKAFIDDTDNLKHHRIWIFSGDKDRVVETPIVSVVEQYHEALGVPPAQIKRVKLPNAGHGMPVLKDGGCDITAQPFITGCEYDAAGELLQWLYPNAGLATAEPQAAGFKSFDQTRYTDANVYSGLDKTGWLYVPPACEASGAHCRLHVVFHGCEQGQNFKVDAHGKYGLQYVHDTGYNRWAEGSRIVLLYPQVLPSNPPLHDPTNPYRFNPKGCWDFWGYTAPLGDASLFAGNPPFARQDAPQMKAVKHMIDDLLRP